LVAFFGQSRKALLGALSFSSGTNYADPPLFPEYKITGDKGKLMSREDEHIIKLQSNAAIYNLLAQAFNYPDTDLLDSLCRGGFTTILHDALTSLNLAGSLATELTDLKKMYVGPDKVKEALLLEMEKDYTHMFFSSKPRLVYLFESVYKEGKLLQDSTFEIARLYYDAGLNLVDDFKLPPDHIAVEFEFMAYLYFNEVEAINKNHQENAKYAQKLQKEVMEKHLSAFGGTLARKVSENARTVFYQSISRIIIPFLVGNNPKVFS
jgi:TorA maturation chaperone TorD